MPFGLSFPELLIILVALLLIFGAKRLPEMGRSLGKGMREFKEAVTNVDDDTVTTPTPTPPPAELPSAPAEPTVQRVESEEPERETIS
jgi:sec-independent protein translocase protein TatA